MMNAEVQAVLEKDRPLTEDLIAKLSGPDAASTTYTYDCRVALGSAGGGYLNVTFSRGGKEVSTFEGGFAGAFGAYVGWGTAWSSAPLEGENGRTAGFTVEVVGILAGTAHVQLTDASSFICNASTGGIGAGGGVGGGAGKFTSS